MDDDPRVLAIGTDADLARPPAQALGDALQRQLKYASILTDYQMVVRTLGGHEGHVEFVSYSPDGRTIYSLATDGIRAWDMATGTVRQMLKPEWRPYP